MVNLLEDSSFFLFKYGFFFVFLRFDWYFFRDNLLFSVVCFSFFYSKCLNFFFLCDGLFLGSLFFFTKNIYCYFLRFFCFSILFFVWIAILGFGFIMSDYWVKVCDFFIENFKNDFFWLIFFKGIKVCDFFLRIGVISILIVEFFVIGKR